MGLVNSTAAASEELDEWVPVVKPNPRKLKRLDLTTEVDQDLVMVTLPQLPQTEPEEIPPYYHPYDYDPSGIGLSWRDNTGNYGNNWGYSAELTQLDSVSPSATRASATAVQSNYLVTTKTKATYHKQRPPKKLSRIELKLTGRRLTQGY